MFSTKHDGKLKKAMLAGSSPADFMDLEDFAEQVGRIRTAARAASASQAPVDDDMEGKTAAVPEHAFVSAYQLGHETEKANNDDVAARVRTLTPGEQDRLSEAVEAANRQVRQFVKLFEDDERAETVAQELEASVLKSHSKSDIVMCLYDIKNSGEPTTVPHLRVASFKAAHLKRCVVRSHKAIGCPGGFPEQAIWVVLDGQKAGNSTAILNSFTVSEDKAQGLPKTVRQLHLVYDEDSATKRLEGNARGAQNMQVSVLETCYLASHLITSAMRDWSWDHVCVCE